MTTPGDDSGSRAGRRLWLFVMAASWVVLGVWVLASGETWLGLAQIALGFAFVATVLSTRDRAATSDTR